MEATHNELCKRGASFLKARIKNHMQSDGSIKKTFNIMTPVSISFFEPSSAQVQEIPDVLGFAYYGTIMIEVKVSRADFLQDKKKLFRKIPEYGVGNERYYLCPEGLIKEKDLPDNWGLLYYIGRKIVVIKIATRQKSNSSAECELLRCQYIHLEKEYKLK